MWRTRGREDNCESRAEVVREYRGVTRKLVMKDDTRWQMGGLMA